MKKIGEHISMIIIAWMIWYFLHIAFCEQETILKNQKTIIEKQDKLETKIDNIDKFLHEPIETNFTITNP